MAADARTRSDEAKSDKSVPTTSPKPSESSELGAPIPPDAIDPELLKLPVPQPRRHPLVAVAVLLVAGLLLYRLRADASYALKPPQPVELGLAAKTVVQAATTAPGQPGGQLAGPLAGPLAGHLNDYVHVVGMPDRRNGLAFDPKGGRTRYHVFRLLGTGTRLLVVTPAGANSEAQNEFSGRLRRFDEVSFAEAVNAAYGQTQALRAIDLGKLRALPKGPLPQPLQTVDRAGEALTVARDVELLIDVLLDDDVRVLLSKEKFPSELDARYEVERLGVLHGPGLETRDGFGYVLRLPPRGAERQKLLAQLDSLGMFFQRRVETYRVPAASVQVGAEGISVPGPDSLPQPVRYQATVPTAQPGQPDAGTAPKTEAAPTPTGSADATAKLLVPIKDQVTLLAWEHVQAVQLSELLEVPQDALLVLEGETPSGAMWTLPLGLLLLVFMAFNLWYLVRSLGIGQAKVR